MVNYWLRITNSENRHIIKEEEIPLFRAKLEPVVIAKKPLDLKEFVLKLRFVKNKKLWSGHLRRAMFNIPKRDYVSFFDRLKESLE